MKKITFLIIFIMSCAFLFSEKYQIKEVKYEIKGITRQYALENKVKIDKKIIFNNEDELIDYLNDFKQKIDNTRVFEKIDVDFQVEEPNENDISLITMIIKTIDSKHLIIVPYPKYDSNKGFSLKLKAKDTNFLGSMEEMSADFNFAIEQKDENKKSDYKFGLNMDFTTPFKLWKLNASWVNDIDISYTLGETTPEWNLKTGLKLELPFNMFSFNFDFYQSFIRDLDYENYDENGTNIHYGDGTYFVENAKFSVPIIIQKIKDWGNIYYTPFADITYNWDFDGISDLYPKYKSNDGLLGPILKVGQTLSTNRINWIGNFRNGLSASLTESISYNFKTYTFSPGIETELKAYKAFSRFGLSTDIYAFAFLQSNVSIGNRLRGIRDEQYFSDDSEDADKKACYTPAAFIINIDVPIRIFKAYWEEIPIIKHIPYVKYFDMEFQLSPFIDFALIKNRSTGTTFDYRDGFLSGGLEAIIYPLKWKGIQVRGSFGVDLGRKMPYIKGLMNQDWRDSVSSYEISIGIGLQY